MCKVNFDDGRSKCFSCRFHSHLTSCCDLVAAEAVYHRKYHTGFFSPSVRIKFGRPFDTCMYDRTCSWLEEIDEELKTLSELTKRPSQLQEVKICILQDGLRKS